MAPLLIPDDSLPLPLVQIPQTLLQPPRIKSGRDLLAVAGTLATDPNGRVWNEWSRSYALLTDTSCSPYPSERGIKRYLPRTETLGILSAFFALSPPLQADNHVALIARITPTVPPHEVRWTPIIDLAYFVNFGLKAAMTRTGSRGHTLEPTPKWMREQLDTIRDIFANSSESSEQLLAATSIARQLRSVPSEFQGPFSSEDPVCDSGELVRRDPDAVGDCHSRDSSSCILTTDTRPVVAHIIPYSCGCMTELFNTTYFWLFLQFWLGPATALTVWEYVGGKRINRLENLVCIGAHVHRRFEAGKLILEPPVRNKQNMPNSAVVLRIWALYPDSLTTLYTGYAPLRSLDKALEAANNNIRDEGLHEISSGEYITLLRSNQSPLPDRTLLAIFSGICRLRRSADVLAELLRSCHDSPWDTNKDGTINDRQSKFPGACSSQFPEDMNHSSNRGPEKFPQKPSWQSNAHRGREGPKRNSRTAVTHALQTHASSLYRALSAIAREQHEGGVVMLGFQRLQREKDREAEENVVKKIRGETSLWDMGDSDNDDGMAVFPKPEEISFYFPDP